MVDGEWWQGIVVNVETSNCILDKFWIALRGAKGRTGDWKKTESSKMIPSVLPWATRSGMKVSITNQMKWKSLNRVWNLHYNYYPVAKLYRKKVEE